MNYFFKHKIPLFKQKFSSLDKFHKLSIGIVLLFIFVTPSLALVTNLFTNASSLDSFRLEAEPTSTNSNRLSGNVSVVTDTSSSNGQAILFGSNGVNGANVTFNPSVIPFSAPEIGNPWHGQYEWQQGQLIPSPWPVTDSYLRYDTAPTDIGSWATLEPTQGNYDFSSIDTALAQAKANGGKLGITIAAARGDITGQAFIPNYLISDMAGDSQSYWSGVSPGNGVYVPDWNNSFFMTRAQALINALAAKYANDPRLGWIETGIYGNYAEWINDGLPNGPSGQTPAVITDANKKTS